MASNNLKQLHELRATPGYTNHVIGINKNISGAISSAEYKRYYSNIDAEIYFNGNWIEDVSDISWNVDQNTQPLFGYNSYLWDDVALGTRIISGMFVINFTRPRYVEDATAKDGASASESLSTANYEDVEDFLENNSVNISGKTVSSQKNPEHYHIWGSKFDIDIVCGEKEAISGMPVHIILKDCFLTGSPSNMRTKDGRVSVEIYKFIARDFMTIE